MSLVSVPDPTPKMSRQSCQNHRVKINGQVLAMHARAYARPAGACHGAGAGAGKPSSASGVPGLAVAMLSSHHPPLTWPSPNCNVSKPLDSFELSTLSIQCQHFYTIWHHSVIPYMSLYIVYYCFACSLIPKKKNKKKHVHVPYTYLYRTRGSHRYMPCTSICDGDQKF